MKFILDRHTYDILFNDAPVDDVTAEEIAEAENDLNRIWKALERLKRKILRN